SGGERPTGDQGLVHSGGAAVTGDQTDVSKRLKSYLPPWFGAGPTPVLDSLVGGLAWALAEAYSFYAYAKLQTRIATATGLWLDLIAWDYFGRWITRKGRTDSAFRAYILANLFRPRATRPSMQSLLLEITGQEAILFEPNRPADVGCASAPGSPGYFGVGRYGSIAVPFTCMIQAFRPLSQGGLAGAAFFNAPTVSAYSRPLSQGYADSLSLTTVVVDDEDIYRAVDFNKVAGTICWVALTSGTFAPPNPYPPSVGTGELDFSDAGDSQYLPAL
ncbi:MAG TPA: hypothetical protein VJP88_05465, partial [Caulobacteraceae bacterium]|nr:hypothetical protein [Caulobacteraceae bacterium]